MNPHINTLLELLKESRSDLRAAQDRLRTSINTIVVASFVISAYYLKEMAMKSPDSKQVIIIFSDITLIAIMLVLSHFFSKDFLRFRLFVEHYEQALSCATFQNDYQPTFFPKIEEKLNFKFEYDNRIVYIAIIIIIVQMIIATASTLLFK